ncbi:MAG: hypothetical protein A2W03_11600 [Candidatus Aminicenantes bacterium RBG_16_63_16]|nr:MAG: hypothetical protein A2W03_11600 [Candidatus Aminicenantes bacterium RBG_16_63_16]
MSEIASPTDRGSSAGKNAALLALLCCVLAAVPFLVVKFPPLTDLPQHVAQVRLFGEALAQPDSPYRIQWITPYSLVYSVLGAAWLLFGAADAGRLGILFIAIFWIILLFWLAYKMKRPALAAALSVILFFSHILYWGFYQFVFGWPLFILWVILLRTDFSNRRTEVLSFWLASLGLYLTHILWFAAALGWLVLSHVVFRRESRTLVFRLAAAAPFLVLAAIWYPSLSAYGFGSPTFWETAPFERLSPVWLADAALGGLKGSFEAVFFAIIIAWILAAWLSNRKELPARTDKELLLLAGVFFALALLLPYKYTNTIRFSSRWVPPALSFLLLGLPRPRVPKNILTAAVAAVLVAFFALTSLNWVAFEKSELGGLGESLAALPAAPRVIGLSYIKESSVVRGSPFIQVFAYAQVYKGGELNFSFADFGPSLVVYRERRRPPWTNGLEWFPERAKKTDLGFFDYALISGDERLHASLAADGGLRPATPGGRWRLYKVERAAPQGSR